MSHRIGQKATDHMLRFSCLASLITGIALACPQEGQAQASKIPLATASKDQTVNMLRWRNRRLRELRLRFNPEAPLKENEVNQLIQTASLGLELGQADQLSLMIRRALNRQQISKLVSYSQLLSSFWETLSESGLIAMSYQSLRKALARIEYTPRAYQRLLLHYLEIGLQLKEREQESYTLLDIKQLWANYLNLLQRFEQVEEPIVRYSIAKHIYLLGQPKEASALLDPLSADRRFKLRVLYLKGLIALEQGELQSAHELFLSMESQLVRFSQAHLPVEVKRVIKETPGLKVVEIEVQTPQKDLKNADKRPKMAQDEGAKSENPYGLSDELADLLKELEDGERSRSMMEVQLPATQERGEALETLKVAFHLAIARIAILRGNYAEAWQRYRNAPPRPNRIYLQSLLEAAYTLRVRGKYKWCARLIDQALAQYPDSEPKVDLTLWKAEMLVKSGQKDKAKLLYKTLEGDLERALFRLKELSRSTESAPIRFHAEIMYWLPRELSKRVERLEVDFKRQELSLKHARSLIAAIRSASDSGHYPAIDLAHEELKQQELKMSEFLVRFPKIKAQWDAEAQMDYERSQQRRGAENNQERRQEASRFTSEDLQEGATQLLSRIKVTRQELKARQDFLKAHLTSSLQSIETAIGRSERKLAELNQQLEMSSQAAHKRATETVEGLRAQLVLGPTLGYFWDKEEATERLRGILDRQRIRFSVLSQLKQEESQAPKMKEIDLLDPILKPMIVDPLPDSGKSIGQF